MRFFAVYAADVVDATRALSVRVMRRKSGVVWFALLFAGSVWLALRLGELTLAVGLPPNLEITPGTLLFVAFFAMLGKGAVDAYHRAIRPGSLVFLLAQPTPPRTIALGKFFTVLWFNLAFVAGALGLAVAFIAAGMRVPLPWEFAASLILAVVAGLASGFALAVLGSLSTWRRKAVGLASYAPVIGFVYATVDAPNPALGDALVALLAVTPIALLGVLASSRFLLEAWNNQTSGKRRQGTSRPYVRLPDPKLEALVDAELKTMVRKRQVALSLATIAVLGIAIMVLYGIVGPPATLPPRFADLFYPIVIAMAIYVAAATQLTVPGMAALGKELDRLWILKSHPVPGRTVYQAKTAAILVLTPAIVGAVVLPLPLAAGFSFDLIAFLVLAAVATSFALTALGVFVGARHPNFDPNTQGLPDSIAMYNVFLAALVVAFAVIGLPVQVYRFDVALGLLAVAFIADLAALLLVLTTRAAAQRYDRLEAA
ncbi:MAG TPA: hypothetical protein VGR51_05955 [Thermoplasmata archaeon]|nr:hypothetical protein [Thermoplasmata archaeon]